MDENNQKSSLWKTYGILMGIMLGGSVLVLLGQSLWNNFQAEQSRQASLETDASPSTERMSPDEAVASHYRLIDNRELEKSWNNLSPSFKGSNLTKGFKEYIEWWNYVEKVYIGDVNVVSSSDTSSVVKADLSYKLRSGRTINDEKKYIYLVRIDGKWLIDGKLSSYNNFIQ